jgi:hypothetical protein
MILKETGCPGGILQNGETCTHQLSHDIVFDIPPWNGMQCVDMLASQILFIGV